MTQVLDLATAIKGLGGKPSNAAATAIAAVLNPANPGAIKIWGNANEKKKIALAVAMQKHIYFFGPAGVGKSTMARAVLDGGGLPYYRFQGHEGFTSDDWYGTATLDSDGKIVVSYSAMVKAVEEGCPVIVEEINMIQPVHMGPLFSFLDDTPWVDITIAGKTRRVTKKKGFRLMVTANDNGSGDSLHMYGGGNLMNQALASRFGIFIKVGYLSEADEIDMIMDKTGLEDKAVLSAMMRVATETRKLASSEPAKAGVAISPRNMIDWANLIIANDVNKVGLDHETLAAMVITNRLSDNLQETLRTFVQNSLGGRVPVTGLKIRPMGG